MRPAAASMQARIVDASVPPLIASNAKVAPVAATASVSSSRNVGVVESSTY